MKTKMRQHAPIVAMAGSITVLGSACTAQEISDLLNIIKIIGFFF